MNNLVEVPFRRQERKHWCIPACLQMVLARFGREVSQADLAESLKFGIHGFFMTAAAYALLRHGIKTTLQVSRSSMASLNRPGLINGNAAVSRHFYRLFTKAEGVVRAGRTSHSALENAAEDGLPSIVAVQLKDYGHVVLTVGCDRKNVIVHDPQEGPNLSIPRSVFTKAWNKTGRTTIILSPYV